MQIQDVFRSFDKKWRTPNSLRDSNVSSKLKTTEEQGVGVAP
jgi:hypothetical protein